MTMFCTLCRYIFKNEKKVGIQELGPRFTLKLRSLQKGTFDSKFGEYEWVHKVSLEASCKHSCVSFVLCVAKNHNVLEVFFLLKRNCHLCFSAMKWTPAEENSISEDMGK